MMSNIGCLMSALSWITHLSVKYGKISSEPERKESTIYFGVYSIIMSVFASGAFVLCVWGITALYSAMDNSGLSSIVMVALIAMLVLVALVILAQNVFGGFMGIVYQFRCNRRPIGYIAVVVYFIASAGMIFGAIYVSGVFGSN